ncbi:hypothetical protein [Massilia endophytica]|uniref:hypothetical protein n=1 Tax=Massilia endophytica TaxID=2899220 RepID=UPI001E569FEC|nr:hypothetical protein [Massilia endophytica]UGQ47838.1 hypothetical protein LSQ66_05040 [Massilia endophytica]
MADHMPPLDSPPPQEDDPAIKARIARLEILVEPIASRLDRIESRFDANFRMLLEELNARSAELRATIDARAVEHRREMLMLIRWLLGMLGATVIALFGLLAKVTNLY